MSADAEFHKRRMVGLFGENWDSPSEPATAEKRADLEVDYIFSQAADCRGPIDLDDQADPGDPVAEFLAKCADELSLAKSGRVDPSWDELIGATSRIELSKEFLNRSNGRMEALAEKIRKLFGEHEEEAGEAVALAKEMRDAVREEFNAA